MPLQKESATFFGQRYCYLHFSLGNVSARQMAGAFQKKHRCATRCKRRFSNQEFSGQLVRIA